MAGEGEPGPGVRARVMEAIREQVRDSAIDHLLEHGFASTTVDDIVRTTGVSRRTFYRYFGTREDLVLGDTAEQIAVLVPALRARPISEDHWTALQRAAEALPDAAQPVTRARGIARLILSDSTLQARHLEKHAAWRSALTPIITERGQLVGRPLTVLAASALVACALTCLDIAAEAWVDDRAGHPLAYFYAQAIEVVRST